MSCFSVSVAVFGLHVLHLASIGIEFSDYEEVSTIYPFPNMINRKELKGREPLFLSDFRFGSAFSWIGPLNLLTEFKFLLGELLLNTADVKLLV